MEKQQEQDLEQQQQQQQQQGVCSSSSSSNMVVKEEDTPSEIAQKVTLSVILRQRREVNELFIQTKFKRLCLSEEARLMMPVESTRRTLVRSNKCSSKTI